MTSPKSRLLALDRTWQRVVFSAVVRNAFLVWLGVSLMCMLLGATTGPRSLQSIAVGWALPVLFTCTTWLFASACAVGAVAAFARRELAAGLWMLGWAAVLGVAGTTGVEWFFHGLGSDARAGAA
jgi:hypothetical protein